MAYRKFAERRDASDPSAPANEFLRAALKVAMRRHMTSALMHWEKDPRLMPYASTLSNIISPSRPEAAILQPEVPDIQLRQPAGELHRGPFVEFAFAATTARQDYQAELARLDARDPNTFQRIMIHGDMQAILHLDYDGLPPYLKQQLNLGLMLGVMYNEMLHFAEEGGQDVLLFPKDTTEATFASSLTALYITAGMRIGSTTPGTTYTEIMPEDLKPGDFGLGDFIDYLRGHQDELTDKDVENEASSATADYTRFLLRLRKLALHKEEDQPDPSFPLRRIVEEFVALRAMFISHSNPQIAYKPVPAQMEDRMAKFLKFCKVVTLSIGTLDQ